MAYTSTQPGSGVVLLSTEWAQNGRYNRACPIDPKTGDRCLTGCANTSAAQILYYWIEHGWKLNLTLTAEDSYTSYRSWFSCDYPIKIDNTEATAQKNGYLSFSQVNARLADFTLNNDDDIAALCFACGVVHESGYSSKATATIQSTEIYERAGMAGVTSEMAGSNESKYFFTGTDDDFRITEAGYEVLINELLSGRPVEAFLPGHAMIWDGYDAQTDRFHLNYGRGGKGNGWYTREEIYEQQFDSFHIDLYAAYDKPSVCVTRTGAYGTGTLLRCVEQFNGIFSVNELTFQSSLRGSRIDLEAYVKFTKKVTIDDFNVDLRVFECCWAIDAWDAMTINTLSGAIQSTSADYACALLSADLIIGNLSGTVAAVSNDFATALSSGSIRIDALSGRVSTAGDCSCTIYSSGTIEINNLTGSVFTQSKSIGNQCMAFSGDQTTTVRNFIGSAIAILTKNHESSSCAFYSKDGVNLVLNDGRIFAGMMNNSATVAALQKDMDGYGANGVAATAKYNSYVGSNHAISQSYQSTHDDVVLLKNHASIQGVIDWAQGEDTLSVLNGSSVYAPNMYSYGTLQLNIDSTSMLNCSVSPADEINITITGEKPSSAMLCMEYYYGWRTTLNVDLRAAQDGEYVLYDIQNTSCAEYLSGFSVNVSTGTQTFSLKCGESANHVTLKHQSGKLILALDGYASAKAEAMLWDGATLLSVGASVSDQTISEDGADSLRLVNGAAAKNITVGEGGDLNVSNQSTATDTRVTAYGFLSVNSGGKAVNTTVDAYGILYLADNAAHSGKMLLGENAVVRADSSATIDFSIAGSDAASYQGISDYSLISGTPRYTLTVDALQSDGAYILAKNVSGFSSTVKVQNPSGTSLGTLAAGETKYFGGVKYALSRKAGKLLLCVGEDVTVKSNAADLDGNGLADIVMTIDSASHPSNGSTGAWLIQSDQTAQWGNLSTRNSNWCIFGTGWTAADKNTSDIFVKSTANVIGAWVTDDGGKVTAWKTVGSFNSDTEILGLGDFNGNGQSDLLLRNRNGAVGCQFTGGSVTGWNYFQSLGDEWKICAIGDMNGDGRSDVVLKHDAGFAGSWLTQSDGSMKWANLDTLQSGFEIVGCGDFNGDGVDDVLLKSGSYYGAWIVKNGCVSGWMGLGTLENVTVEQIADFNDDGIDDLRIRTSYGDLGTQLVTGEDALQWKYYGSVGSEWNTSLASL